MRRCFFTVSLHIPRTECGFSQFCRTNCTHSIIKTIEVWVSFAKQITELTYNVFMKRIPWCQDCSVRTIYCYVVCRAIMGFRRKCWRISKITNTAFRFLLLTSAKFAVRGVDNEKNKGFTIWIHHLMVLLYAMFKTV